MPKKQHQACGELEVIVQKGEQFEWITSAESCDIHILDHKHPLDKDDYHVVKGKATPAQVIGQAGEYYFDCKCKDKHKPHTNPKIIINP